jgi:sugar-specific transcriptional regulator TrmB
MSETLMKVVVDCATNTQKYVPLSAEELAQREADRLEFEAREVERLATEEALEALKTSAKAKLIAGEPMTEEEASVLITAGPAFPIEVPSAPAE